jgi:hypothetical protein
MIELEERLRSALTDLAGELPASSNPMAEQRRRQARRIRPARRRPMLALAAAAGVLAIAVVPAAVTRDAQPGDGVASGPGVQAGQPTAEPRHLDPSPDGPYLTITDGPFPIGEFTEGGRRWSVLAFLERHPVGSSWVHRACVVAVPPGATPNDPNRHPGSTGCAALSDWPADQPPLKVHTRALLQSDTPGGGPLPNLLLFFTVPDVTRLEVQAGYGEPARVTELARTSDLAMYVADFGTTSAGFGYTARDATGAVIETGIT